MLAALKAWLAKLVPGGIGAIAGWLANEFGLVGKLAGYVLGLL